MIVYPAWWHAPTAVNVENWIAQNSVPFPNNVQLYHGTTAAFLNTVTGFNGSEQQWVNQFFQHALGGTAHAGPGIYGADSLNEAQGYGASIMTTIPSTMQRSRYVDVRTGQRPALPGNVLPADVLRHAYRCVIRYGATYYAVKDHRVEWEPH